MFAAECRVDGISLGHYDGVTFEPVMAVREGLRKGKYGDKAGEVAGDKNKARARHLLQG